MTCSRTLVSISRRLGRAAGFTLMELLVSTAVFMVIVGAAVSLFRRHVPLFSAQQNQTGVNIALRNAAAQMQLDLVNAGTGYYQGINIPAWPIGITIQNPPGGSVCFNPATGTYGAGCFDTLNVIAVDGATAPANPSDVAGACVATNTTTLYATPVAPTTAAQLAATYHTGDEILLVKGDGSQMTTAVLTANGVVSSGKVQIQHTATDAAGVNASDPMAIANVADSGKLGAQFCNTDWMLKLSAIRYAVDATNPANPMLVRSQGAGQAQVIADQVVGFRIGAWNSLTNQYEYTVANYNSDWNTIRAVRVSLIGRTNPVSGSAAGFRNTFDNGPYKVEGVSIVVNPRNLSMN
jgi:Tfp pilus assembly protein PilW